MPPQYLILRPAGDVCKNTEVVYCDSDKQHREVLFTGKRWYARRFLRKFRTSTGWEMIPAYCEKKARKGHPPTVAEIPLGSL